MEKEDKTTEQKSEKKVRIIKTKKELIDAIKQKDTKIEQLTSELENIKNINKCNNSHIPSKPVVDCYAMKVSDKIVKDIQICINKIQEVYTEILDNNNRIIDNLRKNYLSLEEDYVKLKNEYESMCDEYTTRIQEMKNKTKYKYLLITGITLMIFVIGIFFAISK